MNPKLFPGAPLQGYFFPITILNLGAQFSKGETKSKEIGDMLKRLSSIMSSPREYFDLYQELGRHYDPLSKYWNKEVFQKLGGRIGSNELIAKQIDDSMDEEIQRLLEGVDTEQLNRFSGIVQLTQDKVALTRFNMEMDPNFIEQASILNSILWNIFMSIFNDEFFKKNISILKKYSV